MFDNVSTNSITNFESEKSFKGNTEMSNMETADGKSGTVTTDLRNTQNSCNTTNDIIYGVNIAPPFHVTVICALQVRLSSEM